MHENVIENPDAPSPRRTDRKRDLKGWSTVQAQRTAEQEGIELSTAHWEIIHFLRDEYVRHGPHPHAREVADKLHDAFADLGGQKYLRQLFPNGPVTQGMRIAGLPVPPYNQDEGFGSSY